MSIAHVSQPRSGTVERDPEANAAGPLDAPLGDDHLWTRILWVNTKTGVAHVYQDCAYLKEWFGRGMVREQPFLIQPGNKARVRFCTQCVSELILEATMPYIHGSESPMLSYPRVLELAGEVKSDRAAGDA